ncbi:hypothetical protein J2Y49_001478 [Azospirillum sp. BE72]|nr:hypothetical protein [Azospirillum sp. BE72]
MSRSVGTIPCYRCYTLRPTLGAFDDLLELHSPNRNGYLTALGLRIWRVAFVRAVIAMTEMHYVPTQDESA